MEQNRLMCSLRKTTVALAAASFFAAPVVFAAPGDRLGSEIIVATNTSSSSSANPVVARNAAGEFVVVWNTLVSGGFEGLLAQRFAADGTPAGAAFPVTSDRYASSPSVAMDAEGDFVVIWVDSQPRQLALGNPAAPKPGINGRSFLAGGVPRGNEFQVSPIVGQTSVAIDDDGDFVVAWATGSSLPPIAPFGGYGPAVPGLYGNDTIHARRYNADGTAKSRGVLVDERVRAIGATADSVSVAMDPAGSYALVWGVRHLNNAYDVYAHRYAADGSSAAPAFRVNDHSGRGDIHGLPSVGVDRRGNLVVAWTHSMQNQNGEETRVKVYAADGSVRVPEFSASGSTPDFGFRPRVAVDPIGNFMIAAGTRPIKARLFGADGTPLSGAVATVDDPTRRQSAFPSIAIDATGSAVVTWDNLNSRGDTSGISAQRFAPP